MGLISFKQKEIKLMLKIFREYAPSNYALELTPIEQKLKKNIREVVCSVVPENEKKEEVAKNAVDY